HEASAAFPGAGGRGLVVDRGRGRGGVGGGSVSGAEARIGEARDVEPARPRSADPGRVVAKQADEPAARPQGNVPVRPRQARRGEAWLLGGSGVVLFFVAWQVVTSLHVFSSL